MNASEVKTTKRPPEQAVGLIDDLWPALQEASAGELGEETVYKALAVFRYVTGGQIRVRAERRANRRHCNVRGWLEPAGLPPQSFDAVPLSVDEQEQGSAGDALPQLRGDDAGQSVESLAEVNRFGAESVSKQSTLGR